MHEGTGRTAYSEFPEDYGLVGKTGTTNDAKDSWFAGYTGDYLSVVWLGRDDNKPIGLTGSTGALPVWTTLMKQISTQPVTLIPPDNIILAARGCGGGKQYPYISGSEPRAHRSCGHEAVEPVEAVEPEDTTPTDVFESDPEQNTGIPEENTSVPEENKTNTQ